MSSSVFVIKFNVNSSGKVGRIVVLRKMIVDKAFIRIIFIYSAIKNSANGPAAYSTLKPETNSDSPSVKSNGARLVSANVDTNHINARGHVDSRNHEGSCDRISDGRENDPLIKRIESRIIANVTSYEIVWATARNAPIRAYLEFDAQPDHRIEYTARLEVARINRAPRFRLASGKGIGSGIQRESARVRARVGAIMNRDTDEDRGRSGSLINSFIASANGWRTPYGPTMFGPLRSCI